MRPRLAITACLFFIDESFLRRAIRVGHDGAVRNGSPEIEMNISAYQWLVIITLDIVIRAGYFFVTSLHVLYIPIALVLSMMHLTLLILIYYSVAPFEWPARTAAAATILWTNTLFLLAFVFIWLYFIQAGRQTVCVGHDRTCYWINGVITGFGAQTIALSALIQVVINLTPVLAICALSTYRRSRAMQR